MITEKDISEFLEHFGVKGQRWGVRRENPGGSNKEKPGTSDITLEKGSKLFNVSARTERDSKGQVYTAHKPKDVANYRSQYAYNQKYSEPGSKGGVKVFSNSFTVTKEVRAAGRTTQVDAFKKMWDKDPSGMARALAEAQKDMKFSAAFNARILKLNRDDIYHKRYMNKGEKWISTKGVQEFNTSLGIDGKTLQVTLKGVNADRKVNDAAKQKYFKELQKRGYNAVVDLNDIKNYGSEAPLLIFKGSKTLTKGKSFEITEEHMTKAGEAYLSEKKLDGYREILNNE